MDLFRIRSRWSAATNHGKREEREELVHGPVYFDLRFWGLLLAPKLEFTYR